MLIFVLIPEPVTTLALPSASFFLNDSNRLKCSAPLVFALRSWRSFPWELSALRGGPKPTSQSNFKVSTSRTLVGSKLQR